MEIGFNYPWSLNHFGADIGPNPYVSLDRWKTEQTLARTGKAEQVPFPDLFTKLDRNLDNLKNMGFSIIRWFVLASGFNYQGYDNLPPIRRQTPSPNVGLPFYDWSFSPPFTTDERFKLNFSELLKRFASSGLKILPSLISFEFSGNCFNPPDYARGLAGGGHADCINDANKRLIFLGTILKDLLDVSVPYKDQIFAWEIMNEPELSYSPFGPLSRRPVPQYSVGSPPPLTGLARYPEVSLETMNEFLSDAVALVPKDFASTVGLRFYRTITEQSLPVGTIPQFHYYAKPFSSLGDPYRIKNAGLFSGNPKPIVGEFDSDLNLFGEPWPDLRGKDTTLNRLKLLREEDCDYAMLWPDLGAPAMADRDRSRFNAETEHVVHDDPIKLEADTRKAVVEFTDGKLPPENE